MILATGGQRWIEQRLVRAIEACEREAPGEGRSSTEARGLAEALANGGHGLRARLLCLRARHRAVCGWQAMDLSNRQWAVQWRCGGRSYYRGLPQAVWDARNMGGILMRRVRRNPDHSCPEWVYEPIRVWPPASTPVRLP